MRLAPYPLTAVLALLVALLSAGCRTTPTSDPRYLPTENVLEVVSVLQRHVSDDTYRFPPALDFAGRNVYRSSLIRLENLQRVHEDALRAGHMEDVIRFSKARALERIRGFDLAAAHYREVAEDEGTLQQPARRGAAICEALDEAAGIGFDSGRPLREGEEPRPAPSDPNHVIQAYEQRVAQLETLEAEVEDGHYRAVIREEMERADLARARYFVSVRQLNPDGNVRAVGELQRVIVRNRESKNAHSHMLSLADLYASLANEYVQKYPPESLLFDPPTFQNLVDSASRLYEVVANQDGTPQKLEASRRLEAFLAFTLRIDRERFSP